MCKQFNSGFVEMREKIVMSPKALGNIPSHCANDVMTDYFFGSPSSSCVCLCATNTAHTIYMPIELIMGEAFPKKLVGQNGFIGWMFCYA